MKHFVLVITVKDRALNKKMQCMYHPMFLSYYREVPYFELCWETMAGRQVMQHALKLRYPLAHSFLHNGLFHSWVPLAEAVSISTCHEIQYRSHLIS